MWKSEVKKENYYSRLDKFLRKSLPDVPMSAIYKFIRKGKVYVNGKRVKDQAFRLEEGDLVEIRYVDLDKFRRRKETSLEPQKMDLDIIYEDEKIIVLNKPAGIALHPGKNIHVATLIEGLMYYGKERGFQPHLVHRLDLNTSGVLVVAKGNEMARVLTDAFKRRFVEKEYITLVKGKITGKGKIEEPLDGQDALTEYEALETKDGLTLLKVRIKTGRKHQIRRHMALIGHHVVGDDKYGKKQFNKELRRKTGLRRQFLHCYRLTLPETVLGERKTFEAPLPEDLRKVLSVLGFKSRF